MLRSTLVKYLEDPKFQPYISMVNNGEVNRFVEYSRPDSVNNVALYIMLDDSMFDDRKGNLACYQDITEEDIVKAVDDTLKEHKVEDPWIILENMASFGVMPIADIADEEDLYTLICDSHNAMYRVIEAINTQLLIAKLKKL